MNFLFFATPFWTSICKCRNYSECIKFIYFSYFKVLFAVSHKPQFRLISINNQLDAQFLSYIFISILYMFRATLCSSSGESIVSIQHLVYVSLCRWPPGMQVENELDFLPGLHTGRSPAQTDIYQMYWYNWLSWWWAQGCSKPVENRNKYIWKELCVKLVIYWNYTEMHGHQNIKYHSSVCSSLCEKCHFPYNLRLLMLFRKN